MHFVQCAQQILNMMTVLVTKNIGNGKLPNVCSEFLLKFIEETHIHINSLVCWTVKRSHFRLRRTTTRLRSIFKKNHSSWSELDSIFLKNLFPRLLVFFGQHTYHLTNVEFFFGKLPLFGLL